MKVKYFFKFVVILSLVALTIGWNISLPSAACAKETIKLRAGCGHPVSSEWVGSMSNFFCKEVVKRVNEKTNYNLVIDEFYGGSVAKVGSELEATESGLLDIGGILTPFETKKLLLHNYGYNIPFFSSDVRISARINDKIYKKFPALKDEFKKYKQVYLGSAGISSYGLVAKFPVKVFEDVKGHKIAAAGANQLWISGVGAVPVQSNLNEAYTCLQTGVYDAWVMFANGVAGFKLYEPCKYYTETGFGATPNIIMITINEKSWNKLPKDVQKIMQEVGSEFGAKEAEFVHQQHSKALKTMKDAGTDIYMLPKAEKVKWAKALVNQPKKFAKEADAAGLPGTALMKEVFKLMAEEGCDIPRNWMEE